MRAKLVAPAEEFSQAQRLNVSCFTLQMFAAPKAEEGAREVPTQRHDEFVRGICCDSRFYLDLDN